MAKEGEALLKEMGAADIQVTRAVSETAVLQGGTCRFGFDANQSVTNPEGALHAAKNVFVTDGGALPTSLAVPMSLTLIANSLRIGEHILRYLK
jgi:choline dehydrogenase-like flavoprotein